MEKPYIVQYRKNNKIGFCRLNNPELRLQMHEADVTNGLDYEPINHYEDSREGLIRHLAEMDLRVTKTDRNICHSIMEEMSSNVFSLLEVKNFLEDVITTYLKDAKIVDGGIFIPTSTNEKLVKRYKNNPEGKEF